MRDAVLNALTDAACVVMDWAVFFFFWGFWLGVAGLCLLPLTRFLGG